MPVLRHICLGLLLLLGFPVFAGDAQRQEPAAIRKTVENFVRLQSVGLPGQVAFTVGAIEPRLNLPACPVLEAFLPPGSRLWGHATVGVRCGAPSWTLYVPVTVRVTADVVVSARPLAQGQAIGSADIVLRSSDLTQLPASVVTEPAQAVGKTLTSSIASGQPLRLDLLRAPLVIQQGQVVKLQSRGRGFTVSSEGRALANAAEGQVVQVRTPSGGVVSGIARPGGVVEVSF